MSAGRVVMVGKANVVLDVVSGGRSALLTLKAAAAAAASTARREGIALE